MPTVESTPVGAPIWIELYSSDMAAAEKFYSELLGWKFDAPVEEFGGYINIEKDGVRVSGAMVNAAESGMPDMWSVYLHTEDAYATAEAATANGGTVIAPAMEVMELGTMAVMLDPSGAGIGAWKPGTHHGFGVVAEPGAPAWFELHTRDHDAAVAFYKGVFGVEAFPMGDEPGFTYTTLGPQEEPFAGVMDASAFLPEGVGSHWVIYFAVDDTDKFVQKVLELGGAVTEAASDSPYGRIAEFTDPTGIPFRVTGPNLD